MEERDYTDRDHTIPAFHLRDLFPQHVLIDLAIGGIGILIILGIAFSGPLKDTGVVFFFLIFPIYFLARAGFGIMGTAARHGIDRLEGRSERAGLPTWPIRAVGSAIFLFIIFLIVAR